MRKTARPVVWEGDGAQSPSLDLIKLLQGLVKVSEFIVGQAIPPASSLASEVFIPISKKLQGVPDELRGL